MHLSSSWELPYSSSGPKKLSELGKGIGEGIRGFKSAINTNGETPDQNPPAEKQG
jgi:Sec-independent protein translocase protein TatA